MQRPNSNSLFRAPIHEGFALSIWFGYYKQLLGSFAHDAGTHKPKSTVNIYQIKKIEKKIIDLSFEFLTITFELFLSH